MSTGHNLLLTAILAMPMTVVLVACDDTRVEQKAEDQLRTAITKAICASNRENLEVAIGAIAVAAGDIPEQFREDTAWTLAAEVEPDDCQA